MWLEENGEALVKTSCKDCLFATYDHEDKTQLGCLLNRLDAYDKSGATLVEAYDEEKEFFVIEGRECPAYLNRALARKSALDMAPIVRERLQLKLQVIVVADSTTGQGLAALSKTLYDLDNQTLNPTEVTVVLNQEGLKPLQVIPLLRDCFSGLAWNLQDVKERLPDGGRVSRERAIDLGVGKGQSTFYSVFQAGDAVPPDFVAALNEALSVRLERFVLALPDSQQRGQTVLKKLHTMLDGSTPAHTLEGPLISGISQKILHVAQTEGKDFLVKRIEEICPSLLGPTSAS